MIGSLARSRKKNKLTKLVITKIKDGHWHHNHCVSRCLYHVVWCTKYRRKVLNRTIQKSLKSMVYDLQDYVGYSVVEFGCEEDHVHLLIQCDPTQGVNDIVGRIKGITSRELREKYSVLRTGIPTLWTRSRYIASVGSVQLSTVKKYIKAQDNV